MKEHNVIIENGEGKLNLVSGHYNSNVNLPNGYDISTFRPPSLYITDDENEYNFTISASGMLMIYAYDGESGTGHQIEGATFYRCSKDGTKYGQPVVTDSSGFAYLSSLPYHSVNPVEVYFVQTSSDGNHSFSSEVRSTSLNVDIGNSVLIENPKIV